MSLRSLRRIRKGIFAALTVCASAAAWAAASTQCENVIITGEVTAGQEWKSVLGQGWVFRVVPVPPLQAGYSGWDLVVDRDQPVGFPDALYMATPPYGSINQREIATTYGVRAQDAVGWNPRSFRFLIDPKALTEAQALYRSAFRNVPGPTEDAGAAARLLDLQKSAAAGELRILDAGLVPGTSDPAPFAQAWTQAASRTGYHVESDAANHSSARGALRWMRFELTLWLPSGWRVPRDLHASRTRCGG
ncbi:MAG TPA: hypothetical protein VGL22_03760 [Terracidiphilus sp.]